MKYFNSIYINFIKYIIKLYKLLINMKTVDKLAHKYALNINQIRGPAKTLNLDFKNLNKGFYDEIEKNDVKIKQEQKELKKLKDISLKEFIYTNKEIPDKWKKKANYEDDLLNLMVNDKNILTYVGTSPKEENIKSKSYSDQKDIYIQTKNSFSNEKENNFPNINDRYITKKIFEKKSSIKEDMNSKNILDSEISKKNTITEEYVNDNSISKISKMKNKSKIKTQLNDKAIYNILEDFKTAYPIKEKLQQLYTTTNYYNTNKSNKINNDMNNNDIKYSTNGNGLITTNSIKNLNNTTNNYNVLTDKSRHTFFSSIKNQQQFKRKNVFRQNVFNNLVSTNTYSVGKKIPTKKKLKMEINKRPYLGSDYQSFIKKVEINSPIINKNLESINYYGPYFSHCPPCYNRNLEYYKNLEINQCLDIIHHIKKMRMKNTILDIKKSADDGQNKPNLEKELILDTQSLKSNENNNDLEEI